MKFTVSKKAAAEALGKLAPMMKKSPIPILENVLVCAMAGGVNFTACDMDMLCSIDVPASVGMRGRTTIPFSIFHDIFRRGDGDSVTVSVDKAASIESGGGKYTLGVLDAVDYPVLAAGAGGSGFEIPSEALLSAVKSVSFAFPGLDETRHYLKGIHFLQDDGLKMQACDGHRLGEVNTGIQTSALDCILPIECLPVLQKTVKGHESVSVLVAENTASFRVDGAALVTKLVDGAFPGLSRIIQKKYGQTAKVNAGALAAGVESVRILQEKSDAISVSVDEAGLVIERGSGGNKASVRVAAEYKGQPFRFGMNGAYLLSALEGMEGDVDMRFSDAERGPVRFDNGTEEIRIVMPMRV